ncbi:electron transport complex subunit RsxB [Solemya velum gill symbiont]|uniref:Ion-translocating oxidoreductase complex subunit B n=1 Tax=Solemya velum gill symbiont TaxID=2340 RepID=A0A0B0H9K5_SOVGS|nr:electron transport complex subunit RsxB [Solemya velum gill symbiont]KHF25322.1 electron transport complex, RnfABCDGE type, subunit B [Solemya velum gill symbiont]OOZ15815.1 electron transport complex subunit RsxB [Solemya velum gill symbiont]OOZ18382.1 electron transport complex subunit RsxB [Solemya velum gill symbiont]OOZ20821.1 electron transport complex subunit RsxB [Solemya velum gill symbiont]OOZ23662.1 electron transport complex subunit RsxB [Solemya velum gill symbiont]
MLSAILTMTILASLFGLLLGYAAVRFHIEGDPIADQIDQMLPQTQCGQCGHPGCRPYADAIARGEDEINKCAPGGHETIIALADLLGRDPIAMDEDIEIRPPSVAIIIEEDCIGCTLCIQACPVDAILGAAKQMHSVIESECTGCELCLPPCPVECIVMEPIEADIRSWSWPYPGDQPQLAQEETPVEAQA